jgi:signal transduction histidine kinase
MVKAPIPFNENLRLQDLYSYEILDTPEEEDFNEIVRLASAICKTPISNITLVDSARQWFKAKTGLATQETSRDNSFSAHAILNGEIFVIPDATKDNRFHDNPLVTGDPVVRFYAGVPLVSPQGFPLGTLGVIDNVPREMPLSQQEVLIMLGKQVVKLMELHKKNRELHRISQLEREQRLERERIDLMQKRLLSVVAHDIRSPLNSLKSLLLLIPDPKGAQISAGTLLEMAGNQLNATLGLLNNIVEWGQLQSKTAQTEKKNWQLQELVKEVHEELASQADIKGLTLKNNVKNGIELTANENMIRFILRNLLTNAIKFTKSGSVIVNAALTPECTVISILDTGIGIPAPILEQLFTGGKKIARKGTHNEAGSGLGLSLVKEFVERMNGGITAKSELGKGTLITLNFPYPG